ncbi:MAG: hypothetical protein JJE23_12475 [Thermoleophilia bacterium]|nr:hypothetical protein [Thermoleophilia bacterium]
MSGEATLPANGEAEARRRPGPEDAIEVARREFLACRRVDIGRVADELGVNRTTVYRWFGGRSGLLAETMWSLSREVADTALEQSNASGIDRVFETMRTFVEVISTSPAYLHLLENEPKAAARVLFNGPNSMRARSIAWNEELLRGESDLLAPGVDPALAARAITRCGEVFLYGDQLGDADPNVADTVEIVRLILDGATAKPEGPRV